MNFVFSRSARIPVVEDRGLSVPNPRVQTFHETVLFAELADGRDRALAHQTKIAGVGGDVDVTHLPHQAIEAVGRGFLQEGFALPGPPGRVDDIETLLPLVNQGGDQFRRILQIGVDDDDGVAARDIQSRGQCGFLAEIPAQFDDADFLIGAPYCPEHIEGPIPASIVHVDNFRRIGKGSQDGAETRMEQGQDLLLIENGNDHRYCSLQPLIRTHRDSLFRNVQLACNV